MASSFYSLIVFGVTLVLYYIGNWGLWGYQAVELDDVLKSNKDMLTATYTKKYVSMGIFVSVVAVGQFIMNMIYLSQRCGTNITGAVAGIAALFTFIPWVLIFGVMSATLIIFPGLKSAFSDVVGYAWIASSANNILAKVLTTDIQDNIDGVDGKSKSAMSNAAEAIMKMSGNNGVMINIMTPENLPTMWTKLSPLMRSDLLEGKSLDEYQKELFELVIEKDKIGEAMWYIYTAILISTIVNYNLSSVACPTTADAMAQQHAAYISNQEKIDAQQAKANSVTYTST